MGDTEVEAAPQSLQALTLARRSDSFLLSLLSAPGFLRSAANALSSVLYSGCYNQIPQTNCLQKQKLISHSSGSKSESAGQCEDFLTSLQLVDFWRGWGWI